ncbi:MAG: sterol desaturase family protein [Calothrix sp. CSU_2_0]|nr:sterol desaturase family protein [Calothrix sp. CSU_2_0]
MLIFIFFSVLLTLTGFNYQQRIHFRQKKISEWILDISGLFFQGVIIPALQILFVYKIYNFLLPNYQGIIFIHPILAFCLSFILIDYIYYWNHRLFHNKLLWSIHQVHHTVTQMDVIGTSRNTLWTSFLIIYLWIHPCFIYLLNEPIWYILGASLTSGLDLWRHSIFTPKNNSFFYQILSPWLILPQDHSWHHASENIYGNFGANFKLWDKIHGTYFPSSSMTEKLGIKSDFHLWKQLFLPFHLKYSNQVNQKL